MFPLKERILTLSAAGHVAQGRGVAADYEAVFVPLYIPFDGIVTCYWGNEGGNWVRLTRPNGDRIEMAHNSEFKIKNGQAKQGQLAAITGNTGSITTGPHLHIQIFNKAGQRLDPEKYNWGKEIMNTYVKTINLDGEVGYFVPLNDSSPGEIELLNSVFNKQLIVNPDGTIPTEIHAKKI